jgi:hypothetical protein
LQFIAGPALAAGSEAIMSMKRILILTLPLVGLSTALPVAADPYLPARSLQFRAGTYLPSGGGDLWTDNESVFTLDAGDLQDFAFGATYAHALNNHVELGFNIDRYQGSSRSSYRDLFENGFPIVHDTYLDSTPLVFDLRWYPAGRYRNGPRGTSPLRPTFYLGAGGGANVWSYEEIGDFVDFSDPALPIFTDRFRDDGLAFQAQVSAGLELPVSRHFNVVLEGRYSWSDAELSGPFDGLGTIDLGGAWLYAAGSFRF